MSELTERFDGVVPVSLRVPPAEVGAALGAVDKGLRRALEEAAGAIRSFHEAERQAHRGFEHKSEHGITTRELLVPVGRAGCYAPGGRAPLASTVLMTVVPARVAGVAEVAVCSPPGPDGRGLGRRAGGGGRGRGGRGVRRGRRPGHRRHGLRDPDGPSRGCHRGPGQPLRGDGPTAGGRRRCRGRAVRLRRAVRGGGGGRRQRAGRVRRPRPSGPGRARAGRVGVAGHLVRRRGGGRRAGGRAVRGGVAAPPRGDGHAGARRLVRPRRRPVPGDGRLQPGRPRAPRAHHRRPRGFGAPGAVCGRRLLRPLAPASVGDYMAGPSHVLPTARSARFSSALGTQDFLKRVHVVSVDRAALRRVAPYVAALAGAEGLAAHAASVLYREQAPSEGRHEPSRGPP